MTPVARVFQHTGQRACLLPGEQESPSSTSQTRLSILFDNEQSRALHHWEREMGTDYFTTRMVSTYRMHTRARPIPPRRRRIALFQRVTAWACLAVWPSRYPACASP